MNVSPIRKGLLSKVDEALKSDAVLSKRLSLKSIPVQCSNGESLEVAPQSLLVLQALKNTAPGRSAIRLQAFSMLPTVPDENCVNAEVQTVVSPVVDVPPPVQEAKDAQVKKPVSRPRPKSRPRRKSKPKLTVTEKKSEPPPASLSPSSPPPSPPLSRAVSKPKSKKVASAQKPSRSSVLKMEEGAESELPTPAVPLKGSRELHRDEWIAARKSEVACVLNTALLLGALQNAKTLDHMPGAERRQQRLGNLFDEYVKLQAKLIDAKDIKA